MEAPEKTLRVNSKVLDKAEIGESATADKAYEARLEEIIRASCPSSKQMGHLSLVFSGGSGSPWFDVMPLSGDGTSGGSGW